MEPLDLIHHHVPGMTVIAVRGELDLLTAGRLEDFFRRVYRPGDQMIFDLAGTGFIDCSGIRALIRAYHDVRRAGGSVHLSGLRPGPAKVVRLTRLGDLMPLHPGLAHAIGAAADVA